MIRLKVISPEKELLSAEADLVEIPGTMGRFEVLINHAPLVSSTREGKLRYVQGNQEHTMDCPAGFVEVRDNCVTVCVG